MWCSSGSLGFFGDGYWYHDLARPFGLDYEGTTFVAKTTTLLPRKGNMPLKNDGITPADLVPSCIKVRPFSGAVLNSVGLSGPGVRALLNTGRWQIRRNPFLISFMSILPTVEERMSELREFVGIINSRKDDFQTTFGLEINFSCPNVSVNRDDFASEVSDAMEMVASLEIPTVPNFSPDVPIDAVRSAARHPTCDAVSIANTLKWGSLPDEVDWEKIWGSNTSPLADLGGGGMSGAPIFPVVLSKVRRVVKEDLGKPIVAGGGILDDSSAEALVRAGASAVKLGTVAMLRPWRVRGIVNMVKDLLP